MKTNKDYRSISPSALSLIRLKAFTQIPFAREAARLLEDTDQPAIDDNKREGGPLFFKLLLHFENRYYTIEKVLSKIATKNVIEVSSGYSFRGLDLCLRQPFHFIDTDLPDIIHSKKEITSTLLTETKPELKGELEILPLNVLQEEEFWKIIDRFPPGPVTIINEGLLVYLNTDEKIKLCGIIHRILEQRGGYWITGDIYIKKGNENAIPFFGNAYSKFKEQHQIDENKFANYVSAESFFKDNGFAVLHKESLALEQLSCLELIKDKKEAVINKLLHSAHSRETWLLGCV